MKGKSSLFGDKKTKRPPLPDGLTRSQRKNIEKGNRIIDDHMTEKDIDGAIRDQKGNPIVNNETGKVYNHLQEVENSIKGLTKIIDRLNNSLHNPNLDEISRDRINQSINEYRERIRKYENGGK